MTRTTRALNAKTPRPWGEMTTHQRTARLAALLYREIAYVLAEELRDGREVCGPAFPTPWRHGVLLAVLPHDGAPAVRLRVPHEAGDPLAALTAGPRDTVILPYQDLADLRPAADRWADLGDWGADDAEAPDLGGEADGLQ